jgi:Spy/CpxP family protein refolding chaperone
MTTRSLTTHLLKMPRTRTTLVALALGVCLTTFAVVAQTSPTTTAAAPQTAAQPASKQAANLDKRVAALTKHLKLTDDQAAKVRPILETQEKEMQIIRQTNKGNRDAMKTAIEARQATFEKEIAAVLTPEQNAKFLKGREKMKERVKERIEKQTQEKTIK